MRGEKLRVWFAPEDMQGGKKLIEQIDRAIQVDVRLLLVLSEHSMNSEWVMTEIRKARQAELALGAGLPTPPLGATEGLPESLETCGRRSAGSGDPRTARQKLFPIRLVSFDCIRDWNCFDADTGKDLAIELREYHIPDFSNWKNHDAFEAAFADLLRDLQAQAQQP
jgi:TIR domain-containing protein